jgi:hypothetical protein
MQNSYFLFLLCYLLNFTFIFTLTVLVPSSQTYYCLIGTGKIRCEDSPTLGSFISNTSNSTVIGDNFREIFKNKASKQFA